MDTNVTVALVTTAGALGVAAIGVWGEAVRRAAKEAREAIGTPNGEGTAIQMLERILAGQAGQDNRIARLEGGQHQLRQDQARTREDVDALTGRVDVLERTDRRPPS